MARKPKRFRLTGRFAAVLVLVAALAAWGMPSAGALAWDVGAGMAAGHTHHTDADGTAGDASGKAMACCDMSAGGCANVFMALPTGIANPLIPPARAILGRTDAAPQAAPTVELPPPRA